MQIFVKTQAGKCITIDCGPSDTIEKIKYSICEKNGIPIQTQVLSYIIYLIKKDGKLYNINYLTESINATPVYSLYLGDIPASIDLTDSKTQESIHIILQDDNTLGDYNIQMESTLRLNC